MTLKEEGSMFGGQSARRKLGGPEMYSVPSNALIAGVPGNRSVRRRETAVD
jgi:hypothetical protein